MEAGIKPSYIIEHGHVPNRRRDGTRELVLKKFLKFPIDEGIPPVKTLIDKSSLLRDSSNPISFGMKPENEGIPPVKTLLDKDSSLRDSSNPTSFGMKPEIILDRLPICDGIVPERELFRRSRMRRLGKDEKVVTSDSHPFKARADADPRSQEGLASAVETCFPLEKSLSFCSVTFSNFVFGSTGRRTKY
uniref:Uncharacterized protein n=1 Tax=Salix viminalis TaxID=40686 RepID=A0A6N2LKG5_SALVM